MPGRSQPAGRLSVDAALRGPALRARMAIEADRIAVSGIGTAKKLGFADGFANKAPRALGRSRPEAFAQPIGQTWRSGGSDAANGTR